MFKSVGITFVVKVVGALSSLLLGLIITRLLPPSEASHFFLMQALIAVLVTFSLFGTDNASLKYSGISYSHRNWASLQGYLLMAISSVLPISLVVGGALYFASPQLSVALWDNSELASVLKQCSYVVVFTSLSVLIAHSFQGVQRSAYFILIMSIFTPLVLSLLLLVVWPKSLSQIMVFLIYVAAFNLLFSIALWIWTSTVVVPALSGWLKFYNVCLPLWVMSVTSSMTIWGSQVIASIWLDAADFAYLSVAQRMALLISFVLNVVNIVMAPKFAALYADNKIIELKLAATKSVRYMVAISAPILVVILLLPERVMSIFGESYAQGWYLLVILSLGQLFSVLAGSVGYLLTMTGHEKDMRNSVIISSVFTVVLSFVFIPVYGVIAAAVIASLGVIVHNLWAMIMVKKRLGFNAFLIRGN